MAIVGDQVQPAINSIGIPAYTWWNEASTGVASDDNAVTTKFAFPITTGMSFNRTLWKETGAQIGREARALMNAGKAYSTFWAPVVNLAREPRWGRNIEVPSEDPFQSGEYATAFVKGFQESPDDPYHVQASACCKHFIGNEMEDSTEVSCLRFQSADSVVSVGVCGGIYGYMLVCMAVYIHTHSPTPPFTHAQVGQHDDRNHVDTAITMQDLFDSYLPPFQACVEEGRVTSLMCSYNAVNGVPSCANDWLLNTVARDAWEFDGAIVSDCDADRDVFER